MMAADAVSAFRKTTLWLTPFARLLPLAGLSFSAGTGYRTGRRCASISTAILISVDASPTRARADKFSSATATTDTCNTMTADRKTAGIILTLSPHQTKEDVLTVLATGCEVRVKDVF